MISYAYGTALVTQEELFEKSAIGQLKDFHVAAAKDPAAVLSFSTGTMRGRDVAPAMPGFEPVQLGKPFRVEIREIYTGDHPCSSFFGTANGEILVTSRMKGIAVYDAAPRAVNLLRSGMKPRTRIRDFGAGFTGTPLIFYCKSLTNAASIITLEMNFKSFPTELIQNVGQALVTAAGIPLFVPASTYLLAAGMFTKLAGALVDALLDKNPPFRQNQPISFITPGTTIPSARFVLLTNDDVDPALLRNYAVDPVNGTLVDGNGRPYAGDEPYMILLMDGRAVDAYETFVPTAAAATVIDKFYGASERSSATIKDLVEGMQYVSDFAFRRQAERIEKDLKEVPPTDCTRRDALLRDYNAAAANIVTEALRLPRK